MTGRVFISYRREDSSGYARAVYNELRGQLGPNNIFMDVDTIEPGVDFIKAIESAEVIKVLLGQDQNTLHNRLLLVDVASNSYETTRLA